jgi:hypothetical protein
MFLFPPPLRGRVREGSAKQKLAVRMPPTPPRKGEGSAATFAVTR